MTTDTELARALRERAEGLQHPGIDIHRVQRRAHGIRRRRRLAGTAVAAAVLAVAVPLGLQVADSSPRSLQPAGPSPTAPAPTAGADGTFPLRITDIPEGAPPQTHYVVIDEQRLVTPEGSRELPTAYPQVLPHGEGWLALRTVHQPPTEAEVAVLDADFGLRSSTPAAPAIAVSDDGSHYAWVEVGEGAATLVVAPADGGTAWRTELPGPVARPIGFVGEQRVAFAVGTLAEDQTFGVAGPDGTTGFGGFLRLDDASAATGLVAGLTQYRQDGTSCSGVADPGGAPGLRWQTCDHTLGEFSPDGQYVVGLATDADGPGSPTLAVLDAATGDPVVEFTAGARGTVVGVSQAIWEDSDTVLAILTQGAEQAIVRLELDGTITRATAPFPTEGMETELWFTTFPWQ